MFVGLVTGRLVSMFVGLVAGRRGAGRGRVAVRGQQLTQLLQHLEARIRTTADNNNNNKSSVKGKSMQKVKLAKLFSRAILRPPCWVCSGGGRPCTPAPGAAGGGPRAGARTPPPGPGSARPPCRSPPAPGPPHLSEDVRHTRHQLDIRLVERHHYLSSPLMCYIIIIIIIIMLSINTIYNTTSHLLSSSCAILLLLLSCCL